MNSVSAGAALSLLCVSFTVFAGREHSLGTVSVLPARGASRIQAKAADELSKHLALISGRTPTGIAAEGALAFIFAKPEDAPAAEPFEACYRIDGNRVWFWGDETKASPGLYPGSQFAVCCFLEEYLGVRWVAPGDRGISFERRDSVALPERRDFVYRPPFGMEVLRMMRANAYTTPFMPVPGLLETDPVPAKLRLSEKEISAVVLENHEWTTRNRLFSPDMPVYGHAFTAWQKRFRETHPEYLALDEKGSRVRSATYDAWIKLCVSNEAVVDQIIADWKAAGCPRYINVCENDGAGFCRCANCLKLDADRPGEDFLATKTDRYLNFYNRVAKKAIAIRPDVRIAAYIYSFYRHPPRRERIEHPDNMVFGTVPSLADDITAFFESWKKVGMKLFFFRPNFHTTLGTLPRGVEKDIYDIFRKAVSYGLIGVDFDSYLWRDVMAPEAFVTVRMIAYPEKSFEELMGELCAAYGEAGPGVSEYYSRIRARREAGRRDSAAAMKKANLLDDSGFVSDQLRIHSETALADDLAVLERAAKPGSPEAAARLDDLIVRARHYVLCYRFLEAGTHRDDARLAEIGRELLRFRVEHADRLRDVYENVMNCRYSGTEGHLWKRIPEVLREFGGGTPRTGLGIYN